MSLTDWFVLVITLTAVILFGLYKSKHDHNLESYLKSNNSMGWFLILLSIMGTQASAITFLSAPGQAYTDGMRFVQYYFGLPFAMIVLCITFVPIYHKLKVFTAYEFLEQRFDLRTRALTSTLFLISRGLSTGISIYAPSIILSSLMGWNIYITNMVMGGLLIVYTVSGGAKAVAYTQMQQLLIIFLGMFLAAFVVVKLLPAAVGFPDAIRVADKLGKMNVFVTHIDVTDSSWWKDKYNIWSGLIGGFFLALSYFGTDQSQVGRYLTAKSLKESRTGLLLNGLIKVPMQFLILLIGILVFSFYLFYDSPVFFNQKVLDKTAMSPAGKQLQEIRLRYDSAQQVSHVKTNLLAQEIKLNHHTDSLVSSLKANESYKQGLRKETIALIKSNDATADTNDTNYIFLYFVIHHLPRGLIGLLIAVIFLAAWGSIAAALNSLAATTVIDLYKRMWLPGKSERHYYVVVKYFTVAWGLFCIATAMFASQLGSLIEAVNVLGSLFYGTILGIFVVAFYMKKTGAKEVFIAAILAECAIIAIYVSDIVSFLWLNVIGCLLVMMISLLLRYTIKNTSGPKKSTVAD